MCGTAAAASSRSTVMRTISEPARASAATCRTVPSMSAVSVLVMDCTTTGRAASDQHAADIDGHRSASFLRPGLGRAGLGHACAPLGSGGFFVPAEPLCSHQTMYCRHSTAENGSTAKRVAFRSCPTTGPRRNMAPGKLARPDRRRQRGRVVGCRLGRVLHETQHFGRDACWVSRISPRRRAVKRPHGARPNRKRAGATAGGSPARARPRPARPPSANAGVNGSPSTTCPAATPNSGVRNVNTETRLAE